jgi:hypothetical protein
MRPGQRIFCLRVVIKSPASPAVGVVTKTAVGSKAALVVIILVAACASDRGSLERCSLMTFFARNDGVPSYQWKASQFMVESARLSPTGVLVTLFTPGSELTLMGIVLLMARDATGGQFVAKKADVTGVAIDLHMRAAQGILCFVVIEPRLFPVILPVACFTFGPVAASVNILNFVACDACCADTGISLAGVTE